MASRWLQQLQISCPYVTAFPSQEGSRKEKNSPSRSFSFVREGNLSQDPPSRCPLYLIGQNKVTWPPLATWEVGRGSVFLLQDATVFWHCGTHWGWWEEASSKSPCLFLTHVVPYSGSPRDHGVSWCGHKSCVVFNACWRMSLSISWNSLLDTGLPRRLSSANELTCSSTVHQLSSLWSQQ